MYKRQALKECWHALDFLPYTDGGILSFQDKLIKPMPEIYRLILDRYRLEPDELSLIHISVCASSLPFVCTS